MELESPLKVRKEFGKTGDRIFYSFGPFEVDVRERVLNRKGKSVAVTPKVFDILLVLIRNAGRILSKDEMIQLVWPDTAVEESNLSRNVSTLRKALGEEPDECRYIETIPWRGYRFVASVQESRERPDAIDSLAVLPFASDQTASMDYLSEGLTDSLIDKLSLLPGLKVMSRNSVFRYRAGESKTDYSDAQRLGTELRVRAVLTGRIRQIDTILLVSVELIDVADGSHLWGGQYNRQISDMVSMQEAMAHQIADRLRLRLTSQDKQRLVRRETEDPDAFQLYLKGRHFWNKLTPDGVAKGLEFFKQSVEKDPMYARGYAGLQKAYGYLNMPVEARKAAARALELDPDLSEAHASLGFLKFLYDWDFRGAEEELQRAIALNPNCAEAHHWYAILLANLGRHSEAIVEAERARELDPLSLLMNQTAGNVLFLARDYDGAIAVLQRTLELDAHFAAVHSVLGCVYVGKGLYPEALAQFEKVRTLAGDHAAVQASITALIGWVNAARGKKQQALKAIEELTHPLLATPYSIAGIYATLGEKDRAFEWLERACQSRSFQLVSLKVDLMFDKIRSDPRYIELQCRVGLPA